MSKPALLLPPRNGEAQNITIECPGNIVLIGANGSGKSRLGAWIEQNIPEAIIVHRISAQRALDVPQYAPLKTLQQSLNELLYGHEDSRYANKAHKLAHRWQNKLTTILQNDYAKMLSALFAKTAKRDSDYVSASRTASKNRQNEILTIPDSAIDTLLKLWADIMPQRELILDDGQVKAKTPDNNEYSGEEMSDGERVAIYLLGQSLCAPDNSIVIIDEPEIHLHRSIMSRLWNKIEEARPNCLFVYITHDITFASSRVEALKIWVKSYNGNKWDWDETPEIEGFPEDLILEILGNRKKVLFVEGEKGSLDEALYQAIYPDFFIVPRGSCQKVIESTRALRGNTKFHHLEIHGIIDRDYRTEEELDALAQHGIHSLSVAEIENLICIDEIVREVCSSLILDFEKTKEKVHSFIISRLREEQEVQVARRTASEVHFRLNSFNESIRNLDEIKGEIEKTVGNIKVEEIYQSNYDLFTKIVDDVDFVEALRYFNRKSLPRQISSQFNLKNGEYENIVLRLMKTKKKTSIVEALSSFTPTI